MNIEGLKKLNALLAECRQMERMPRIEEISALCDKEIGVDIKHMWALLNESNAETMQMKMFRNEGDEKPFRCIVFIEGEEAVAKVAKFLEKMGGESVTTSRIKT